MTRGQSAILTYHSLDESGSVISIAPALFRRQMEFLARSGIPVLPLNQAIERPGSVAITFDDGFRNFSEEALPVLERYRLPATVFVVSRYCGQTNDWPSQAGAEIPRLPLLSWEELSTLPPLISVGAHTATHPDLGRLSAGECGQEMRECRDRIEEHLGRPPRWLAYPYGYPPPPARSQAGLLFELAVGTSLGFVSPPSDRLDLPRIDTFYLRGRFPLERWLTGPGNLLAGVRGILRRVRRFPSRYRYFSS